VAQKWGVRARAGECKVTLEKSEGSGTRAVRRWESMGRAALVSARATLRPRWLFAVALSAATLVPACGSKQRTFPPDATAGKGASAGSGGASEAAAGGTEAEGAAPPVDGGAGSTIQPDCAFDQTTCIGNAPATCSAGSWVVGDECSGALPTCSNGTCASARVLGGIVTLAPVTGANGAVRVVEQSFNIARTSCGVVAGEQVCVTGGIKP
jgi:hypothetical protein